MIILGWVVFLFRQNYRGCNCTRTQIRGPLEKTGESANKKDKTEERTRKKTNARHFHEGAERTRKKTNVCGFDEGASY